MDAHAFLLTEFAVALSRLFVTFGGSGGIVTTARTELPYPCTCSSQAKTRDESSRRGKYCDGIASLGRIRC